MALDAFLYLRPIGAVIGNDALAVLSLEKAFFIFFQSKTLKSMPRPRINRGTPLTCHREASGPCLPASRTEPKSVRKSSPSVGVLLP